MNARGRVWVALGMPLVGKPCYILEAHSLRFAPWRRRAPSSSITPVTEELRAAANMQVHTAPAACGNGSGCVVVSPAAGDAQTGAACSAALPPPTDNSSTGSPTQLPPDLLLYILRLLPRSDIALSARRACKAAWLHLCEEHHCTALLSQPRPQHAAAEAAQQLQPQLRLLTMEQKVQLLATAASSGTETNTEVPWGLVKPCLVHGMVPEEL